MTTDVDRAFKEWWIADDLDIGDDELSLPSAIWHAAIAWATVRERERAAKIVQKHCVQSGIIGALSLSGEISDAIRAAVEDKETANNGSKLAPHEAKATEDLCDDEGCPHFGTPHVCISTTAADDKPDPPADLVELAGERFGSSVTYPTVRAIAAFAAEYAAGVVRDMASRFADDVAYWKERAEAAEQALAEERVLYKSTLDNFRVTVEEERARTKIAIQAFQQEYDLRTDAEYTAAVAEKLIEEEREACAKVAEATSSYDDRLHRAHRMKTTGARIAAAIRSRKGGGDERYR